MIGRRTGQRAIVNVRGDLIVRPLPLEQRLLPTKLFGMGQIKDHFLSEYFKSLLGIMEAQFRGKGAPGGVAGVVALLQASKLMVLMIFITRTPKALLHRIKLTSSPRRHAPGQDLSSPQDHAHERLRNGIDAGVPAAAPHSGVGWLPVAAASAACWLFRDGACTNHRYPVATPR